MSYSAWVPKAVNAWNNSGADCNITISSSSQNEVFDYYNNTDTAYGYYRPNGSKFTIELNRYQIDRTKEWNGFAQSVIVHELGHGLGLADLPGETRCIMGGSRDRNHMLHPSQSDINGVNNKW